MHNVIAHIVQIIVIFVQRDGLGDAVAEIGYRHQRFPLFAAPQCPEKHHCSQQEHCRKEQIFLQPGQAFHAA